MKQSSNPELLEIVKVSSAQVKKNRKTHEGNSLEDQMIAVNYLSKVIPGLREKLGRAPYRTEILDEMKRIGFNISISTLWRYKGKIKKISTSVRDLLEEGTYSAYFDHNMTLLDDIEEYATQCYLKTWTNSKIEKLVEFGEAKKAMEENRPPNGTLLKSTTTGELAAGKTGFLNILVKVVDLRRSALNDENINLASAMLSEDFQSLKEKFELTESKNKELEKELKSVLKRKSKSATSSD